MAGLSAADEPRRTTPAGAVPKRRPRARTAARENAIVDCGWGRLLFAQTFADPLPLIEAIRAEAEDTRDIAFYVSDPHVLLAHAPQELFLDPSHTYRVDLAGYTSGQAEYGGFTIRALKPETDAEAVNLIYARRGMVQVAPDFMRAQATRAPLTHLVAVESGSDRVIGTVTGVDHAQAFGDPERGSSLWCLAVDPAAASPGIGEALVRSLTDVFKARDAAYMDLSVMHDNEQAIALYEKLGFHRVSFFAVKRKNPINEPLFTGPLDDGAFNPYARIIISEARRRGIFVEPIDPEGGFFRLSYGGRSVRCRESLSELTSAVAMSICDDKAATRRVIEAAGVQAPAQIEARSPRETIEAFLQEHGAVVVKPARGEQGRGVAVGLETLEAVEKAITRAEANGGRALIEQCVSGEDLRVIVIDFKVVAAAVRRPARVIGDGRSTIRRLIERQSRRRASATGGESRIPIDAETERTLRTAGFSLDHVLDEGVEIAVRRTANLHTGGTIHDVTPDLHPALARAAIAAARAIDMPVVGIDFMVRAPDQPDYHFIEANERPGLANHEPQPTAERFIDLLFPMSIPAPQREREN